MAKYNQDNSLPSHGRRAKAENVGTVRVRIFRSEGLLLLMNPQGFDFYLNIDTNRNTYHATIEHGFPPNKEITSIEIPSEVLDEVVALAHNKEFMSLKNKDIFPDQMMLDGYDVRISVKTDAGNVSFDNNMLEDTLWDGFIGLATGGIQTPFDKLAAFAFELLGIEPEVFEDEEEDSIDA